MKVSRLFALVLLLCFVFCEIDMVSASVSLEFFFDPSITQLHLAASAEREILGDGTNNGLPSGYLSRISPRIAEMLIDAGADKDARNDEGKTALDVALENRNFKIAALLGIK